MGTVIITKDTTKYPITMIGRYAGVCWGANTSDNEKNYKRGLDCIESEHGRTWEFPDVYAIIDGYSAKVLREWYTHVGGLPTRLQASTRYINYSNGEGFKYVTPPTIANNNDALAKWTLMMSDINDMIGKFIDVYNIPVEDATMALPIAYQSKMVDKRNFRNVVDMSNQRTCSRAYWEYRNQLMKDYLNALREYSEQKRRHVEENQKETKDRRVFIMNKNIEKEILNNQKVIMRTLRTITSKKYNNNDNSKLDYDLLEYRIGKTGELLRTLEDEN